MKTCEIYYGKVCHFLDCNLLDDTSLFGTTYSSQEVTRLLALLPSSCETRIIKRGEVKCFWFNYGAMGNPLNQQRTCHECMHMKVIVEVGTGLEFVK